MKILVTSSTGITGKAVVRHLARKGAIVRAMTGMDAVFYICPTAHPLEGEIGKSINSSMIRAGDLSNIAGTSMFRA